MVLPHVGSITKVLLTTRPILPDSASYAIINDYER